MLDADYMRQPCGSDAHARVVDIQSLEPAWESQADIVEETAGHAQVKSRGCEMLVMKVRTTVTMPSNLCPACFIKGFKPALTSSCVSTVTQGPESAGATYFGV